MSGFAKMSSAAQNAIEKLPPQVDGWSFPSNVSWLAPAEAWEEKKQTVESTGHHLDFKGWLEGRRRPEQERCDTIQRGVFNLSVLRTGSKSVSFATILNWLPR